MNSLDLIKKHEGLRLEPYKDSEGILTVGWGHNLERRISMQDAVEYLEKDFKQVKMYCSHYPWYKDLNEARQAVIENMIFNLGPQRFSHFVKTIQYLSEGNYEQASFEMLDSKWAVQVGNRAAELSTMMRTGKFPD